MVEAAWAQGFDVQVCNFLRYNRFGGLYVKCVEVDAIVFCGLIVAMAYVMFDIVNGLVIQSTGFSFSATGVWYT